MQHVVLGLGNPDMEYHGTRHNVGRMVLDALVEKYKLGQWDEKKSAQALVIEAEMDGNDLVLVKPETYMNKSGASVLKFVKSKKAAEHLVVVQDEIDLPLGSIKIVFDRSSGGHRGVESISRALKTNAFIRVRVGVCPTTASGNPKKPHGEDAVVKFLLGRFSPSEQAALKNIIERAVEAVEYIVCEGTAKAQQEIHSK